jgi:hypothetical protein
MKVDTNKAISRPLAVAIKLAGNSIVQVNVYTKLVVLTGDRNVLLSQNGHWCFMDALTLLSRIVGNLVVMLPDNVPKLTAEATEFCQRAWHHGSLRVINTIDLDLLETADAILNVGTRIDQSRPWTVVNSNGWVARVSSGQEPLPDDVDQSNPMAALMAASFGATEVFKRIFEVPQEVAPLWDRFEFSLFEQTTTPTSCGPRLIDEIRIPDTLMIGGGAIGNGIALIASRLPLSGRIHLVDKQDYADENLGTCILTEREGWLGEPKAVRLAAWLRQRSVLTVSGEKALIESAKSGPTVTSLAINLVLNGLDDPEARRSAQDLWPAIIVDGGINEIGAAVTQFRLDQQGHACLKCWFETEQVDERKEQSRLTGLSINSLTDGGRQLTDEDIARAAEDKQAWLRERKQERKTLCSIISEAALTLKLGVDVEDGFTPSVPFIATAAAAMVMAEAIKALVFPSTPIVANFQIANLFIGPEESSISLSRFPSRTCQCVVHRTTIDNLAQRKAMRSSVLTTMNY